MATAPGAIVNTVDLKCDNYDICRGVVTDQGEDDRIAGFKRLNARARAKGWHIYVGETQGGVYFAAKLCPLCVGERVRLPKAPDVLPGQEQLF